MPLKAGTISTRALIARIEKHLELVDQLANDAQGSGKLKLVEDLNDLADCVCEYIRISENGKRAMKISRRLQTQESYDDSPKVSER